MLFRSAKQTCNAEALNAAVATASKEGVDDSVIAAARKAVRGLRRMTSLDRKERRLSITKSKRWAHQSFNSKRLLAMNSSSSSSLQLSRTATPEREEKKAVAEVVEDDDDNDEGDQQLARWTAPDAHQAAVSRQAAIAAVHSAARVLKATAASRANEVEQAQALAATDGEALGIQQRERRQRSLHQHAINIGQMVEMEEHVRNGLGYEQAPTRTRLLPRMPSGLRRAALERAAASQGATVTDAHAFTNPNDMVV